MNVSKALVLSFIYLFSYTLCQQTDIKLTDGSIQITTHELALLKAQSSVIRHTCDDFSDEHEIDLTPLHLNKRIFGSVLELVGGKKNEQPAMRKDIITAIDVLGLQTKAYQHLFAKPRLIKTIEDKNKGCIVFEHIFWNKPSSALIASILKDGHFEIAVFLRSENFSQPHLFAQNIKINNLEVNKTGERLVVFAKSPEERFTIFDISADNMEQWQPINSFAFNRIADNKNEWKILAFSVNPSGNLLAIPDINKCLFVDAASGHTDFTIPVPQTDGGNQEAAGIEWHPEGVLMSMQTIIYSVGTHLLDINNKETKILYPDICNFVWSPDGKRCSYSSADLNDRSTKVFDGTNAKQVITGGSPEGLPRKISFSPCGSWLAIAHHANSFFIDINTLLKLEKECEKMIARNVSWSHDGQLTAWAHGYVISLMDTSDLSQPQE